MTTGNCQLSPANLPPSRCLLLACGAWRGQRGAGEALRTLQEADATLASNDSCVRLPGFGVLRVDRARLGVAGRLCGRLAPRARVVDDVEALLDDLLACGARQQLEAAIAAAFYYNSSLTRP